MGYADINIDIIPDTDHLYAHSSINDLEKVPSNFDASNLAVEFRDPSFEALEIPSKSGDLIDRVADSEYKILVEVDVRLQGNLNASGKITVYTERVPCASCQYVAQQFKVKYPNIEVEIIGGWV